jgi:hypothetical protein
MSSMKEKTDYIADLAIHLHENQKTMSAKELAEHLNRNKVSKNNGTAYKVDERGIYRLIGTIYKRLKKTDSEKAGFVAKSFVKANGKYAYVKK